MGTVLEFMGEPSPGPLFGYEVNAYRAITGARAYRLGLDAVGDASFVTRPGPTPNPPLCAMLCCLGAARCRIGAAAMARRNSIAELLLGADGEAVVASDLGWAATSSTEHTSSGAGDLSV